jgi:hypothetical protein
MANYSESVSGLAGGVGGIIDDAYNTLNDVETVRSDLMDSLQAAASVGSSKVVTINDNSTIDISTGAGALVLDTYLQELSTVEQSAAQIVAQHNKAQKTIHSQTGQS